MADSSHRKGGLARAKNLTPEQRREIAKRAAKARWEKIEDAGGLPVISHRGPLKIGDVEIDAYRLKDGRRLISKKGMAQALGLKSGGGNAFLRSMTRKGVRSEISEDLWNTIENPIFFRLFDPDSENGLGGTADGYEADTLIDVCKTIVSAQSSGKLHSSQYSLSVRAEIIIRAAAKLGITALIDEAVGYRTDHRIGEYQQLFEKFILDECRQWEQEFPDKFLDMIYRLYGLKRVNPDSTKTPRFFGHFIRRYVYAPLAHSKGAILDELDQKNPVVYSGGGRKFKFHQFLTEEIGVLALRQQLWQVIGIGNVSRDAKQFKKHFYRAFPDSSPIGHQWDLLESELDA